MKIRIVSRKRNPLLKRMEIIFEVDHSDRGGTPQRLEVRESLAKAIKADLKLVYIRRMVTKTGTMTALGEANAYDSLEQARHVEPNHVLVRYGLSEPVKSS